MSLRARLALIAAFLALLGLGLGLGFSNWLLSHLALVEVDHSLRLQAKVLLEAALGQPDRQVPLEVEQEVLGGELPAAAWLYRDGVPLWSGGLTAAPAFLSQATEAVPQTLLGWRVYVLSRGEYRLVVAQPLGAVERLTLLHLRLGLLLLLLVGLITGAMAYGLVGMALRPLRRMAEAALRFQVVTPPEGRDEVAHLAQAFARLLTTLKEEREREQTFLALASHELRTPIAALRVGLERLLYTPVLDRETLKRLRFQAERLEALAENLLALSRAQAQDLRLVEMDLAGLAGVVFDRFQPMAVAQGREIFLEAGPARLLGDPQLLERALNNLVHNALVHGRGRVFLRVGEEHGRPFIEVQDEGPGLAPQVREGFGMRVVRQVARVLGADLSLTTEGGLCVRLTFRSHSVPSLPMATGAKAPEVSG
jgi:two-component system OmpR family sensor kinase